MIQDIGHAKKNFVSHGFSPYSSAYVTTNENLRNVLQCVPKDINRALTVAASGDHPMFTKLHGAKYVDTFDISFNAELIMNIKTNALVLLDYKEYCKLLEDLYTSKNIMHVKHMPKITEKLNTFEQQYIKEMCENALFCKGLNSISLPTKTEFRKMRRIIKEPFNFIWSDVQNLHTKLTKTYDFIHLSNIFDYLLFYRECIDILGSLIPHTNPGCHICITCFHKNAEAICENFVWEQKILGYNEQSWAVPNIHPMTDTCIIQRIR